MLEVLKNTQTPVPVVVKTPSEVQKDNTDADYEYTRKNLKKLAEAGAAAIEHFKDVAEETGEPRAFEVLATLLKNTGELVKGVMENASIKANIDKRNEPVKTVGDKENPTFNNATVFIGTTRDMLDKINNDQKTIDAESTEIK